MIDTARPNPLYLIVSGLVFAALAILAIVSPRIVIVAPDYLLAAALIIGGLVQLWNSRQKCMAMIKKLYRWLGLALIVAGLALATVPALNFSVMGVVIAIVCGVAGIYQLFLARRMRAHRTWLLMLAGAIISISISLILLAQLPEPSVTLVGILFGISAGVSAIAHIIAGADLYRH